MHPHHRPYRSSALAIASSALFASLALSSTAFGQATVYWNNIDSTNPPGETQKWNDANNWINTSSQNIMPGAAATVNIWRQGGGGSAAYVLLDHTTPNFGTNHVTMRYGSTLVIADGGHLQLTGASKFLIGGTVADASNASFVTVEAGGQITSTTTSGAGGNSPLYVFDGSTLTNRGTINVTNLTVQRNSLLDFQGGAITTTHTNGVAVVNAAMTQSGGTLSTASLYLNGGGTYTISGGSIVGNTSLRLNNTTNFAVVGGAATINFTGYSRDSGSSTNQTFSFKLDNSANHISTIDMSTVANAASRALRDNANLSVSLQGGVLLSSTNTFTLITRGGGNTDTGWLNQATAFGDGSLWKDATLAKTSIQIGFKDAQSKGTLDASSFTPVTFDAATVGYINLLNVDTGAPLVLGINVTGGTLSHFTDALTAAGIGLSAVTGDYDLAIILNPGVSGGSYFAWDLSSIDSAMGITSVGVLATIPEPASLAGLAGLAGLLVVLRRRRK